MIQNLHTTAMFVIANTCNKAESARLQSAFKQTVTHIDPVFFLLVSTKPTAYHSNTSPPQEVTFLRTTAGSKHEDIMGEGSNGNAICFE
jgi:hypothetical protein